MVLHNLAHHDGLEGCNEMARLTERKYAAEYEEILLRVSQSYFQLSGKIVELTGKCFAMKRSRRCDGSGAVDGFARIAPTCL